MTHTFTPATLSAAEQALRAALPRWSLAPDSTLSLINLSENATYRVDDPAGQRPPVVVRLHRLGYHQPAEIASELAWLAALRHHGAVEVPAPLPAADGQTLQFLPDPAGGPARPAVAFAFLPGSEPPASAASVPWFHTLGAITARLHRHARQWRRPPGFRRKTWDVPAMFGPRPLWGPWQAAMGLDAPGAALLGRAIALIGRRMKRFGRGPDRFGLIHADLRLANLLVDPPHLRVLDFDDCGFGWYLYDFAAAVSFFEHEPVVDDLMAAWLDGYRTQAPLSAEDAAELPVFVAMRRFLLVAWLASHAEVPLARDLGAGYTTGALDMAEALLSRHALPG